MDPVMRAFSKKITQAALKFPMLEMSFFILTMTAFLLQYYFPKFSPQFQKVGLVAFTILILWRLIFFRFFKNFSFLKILNNHPIAILISWVIALLTYSAVIIFSSPFNYEFQHGDSMFFSQTLWNLTHGAIAESSIFTMNGVPLDGSDVRYVDSYGYVSTLTLHQYWLPTFLIAPLYALYPYPPMHIFSLQFSVIILGTFGTYWAINQVADCDKWFSVVMAICYFLIPQVESQIFFKGYWDVLGLGVLPWLLGGIISKKWIFTYFASAMTAMISFPFTNFVIIAGIFAFLLHRSFLRSLPIALIGITFFKFDQNVFQVAVQPYLDTTVTPPNFYVSYVLNRTLGSLVEPFIATLLYSFFLIQGLAFLPILAAIKFVRIHNQIIPIGISLILLIIINLFRGYGWEFQRNSFIISPIYLLAAFSYLILKNYNKDELSSDLNPNGTLSVILFSSLIAMILCGNPYPNGGLASHYPWGANGIFSRANEQNSWGRALTKVEELVGGGDMAWMAPPELHASLANRRNSWIYGREPAQVRYVVIVDQETLIRNDTKNKLLILNLYDEKKYRLRYSGYDGKNILLFENLNSGPIKNQEFKGGLQIAKEAFYKTFLPQ